MGIFEIAILILAFDFALLISFLFLWSHVQGAASSEEEKDNVDKVFWKKYFKPLLIIGAVCFVVMGASVILEEVNGPARCPICHERDCPGATAHTAEIWEYSEK